MADSPTCAQCGGVATRKGALCSPCRKELAEKAAEAARKKREGK
jgi:predicted amidophosphoribosyltransferase